MNELVTIKDNQIIISEETIQKIREFEKMKLKMDLVEKEVKERLKEAMKLCGKKDFTGYGIYANIAEVKGRETIDTARLKKELPDVAQEYTKVGKPTERFTFKLIEE